MIVPSFDGAGSVIRRALFWPKAKPQKSNEADQDKRLTTRVTRWINCCTPTKA